MRDLDWSDVVRDAERGRAMVERAEREALATVKGGVRLAPGWSHAVTGEGDVLFDEVEAAPEHVHGDTWQTVVTVSVDPERPLPYVVVVGTLVDGSPDDWPEVCYLGTLAEVAAEVDIAMFGWGEDEEAAAHDDQIAEVNALRAERGLRSL